MATVRMIRSVARDGIVHAHRFMPLPGTALAGAAPRPILREAERVCGKLALAGKLTGSWGARPAKVFLDDDSNDRA